MHDCVGVIIGGVQHTDGPLQVKYWGVLTPVTPAALTPMTVKLIAKCSIWIELLNMMTRKQFCLQFNSYNLVASSRCNYLQKNLAQTLKPHSHCALACGGCRAVTSLMQPSLPWMSEWSSTADRGLISVRQA